MPEAPSILLSLATGSMVAAALTRFKATLLYELSATDSLSIRLSAAPESLSPSDQPGAYRLTDYTVVLYKKHHNGPITGVHQST